MMTEVASMSDLYSLHTHGQLINVYTTASRLTLSPNRKRQHEVGRVIPCLSNDMDDGQEEPVEPEELQEEAAASAGKKRKIKDAQEPMEVVEISDKADAKRREKLEAFLHLCDQHLEFLTTCKVIDKFLLAITRIYMERARLSMHGYKKERYLFYALYIALETEEDSLDGVTEVLKYLLGPPPCAVLTTAETRKAELARQEGLVDNEYYDDEEETYYDEATLERQRQWDYRLKKFYRGKNAFWKRLQYRTYVSLEECLREISHLPDHAALSRERTEEDLQSFEIF